jgi:hypothetical protein
LFTLYINDLPDVIASKCVLFSDDISVIVTANKRIDMDIYESYINDIINNISNWATSNNLCINLDKTCFIQFSNYGSSLNSLVLNYKGHSIKECN